MLGVTFADGSTLSLTANSRLMVNEFVYDSNGSANSEIINLVQGSLSFISGEVAHSGGNMKIATPVATMGIRGTVGGVTQASDGTVSFFVVESATGAVVTDAAGARAVSGRAGRPADSRTARRAFGRCCRGNPKVAAGIGGRTSPSCSRS